jgi:hypothetical protein
LVWVDEEGKERGMKESSELEKLNFAARAAQGESTMRSMRIGLSFLSPIFVLLAIFAEASPLENAATRGVAAVMVVTTILVYARWRYAPALAGLIFLCVIFLRIVDFGRKGWPGPGLAYLLMMGTIFILLAKEETKFTYALWASGRVECTTERERVDRWIHRLQTAFPSDEVIEFKAGDFWSSGREIIRVLRDGNWLVVARFRRCNLSRQPVVTVLDAGVAKVKYSRTAKLFTIDKTTFHNVKFAPESIAAASQLTKSEISA